MILRPPPTTALRRMNAPPLEIERIHKIEIEERWPNSHVIYTDGSLQDGKSASAFYDATTHTTGHCRSWNHGSIYSSEAQAIMLALKHFMEHCTDHQQVVILTDSKSVTQKLSHFNLTKRLTFFEYEILKNTHLLANQGKRAIFCWLKGHNRIPGNERADTEAKNALQLPEPTPNASYPPTDLKRKITISARSIWKEEFASYNGGSRYKSLFPNLNRQPWFHKLAPSTDPKPKSFFTTITRLRTGHSNTGHSKFLKGLIESPNCPHCPGILETINHILLECPNYSAARIHLFHEIDAHIPHPFNVDTLASSPHTIVQTATFNFLMKIGIYI